MFKTGESYRYFVVEKYNTHDDYAFWTIKRFLEGKFTLASRYQAIITMTAF